MTLPVEPLKGGFLRSFGCAWFIREFLLGYGPNDSSVIDPDVGAPQADIFYQYKLALMKATALDRATRQEEFRARREKRPIDPEGIESIAQRYFERMPYKAQGCRYHSFVVYFSMLQRLGWVEATGQEELSAFQEHYPSGQPRRYYRLSVAGLSSGEAAWANPHRALYR